MTAQEMQFSTWNYNVADHYKGKDVDFIRKDLQKNAHSFAVLMEHWKGDFNISTMIRNANAFNAKEVFYIGKKKWDRRGAVGTHHYTPLRHVKSFDGLKDLKSLYTFVAIDNNMPDTLKLTKFNWNELEKPPLMIFGEESQGLTEEMLKLCDYAVEITQYGSVRSLNVGTSSGIVMFDYVSKLKGG